MPARKKRKKVKANSKPRNKITTGLKGPSEAYSTQIQNRVLKGVVNTEELRRKLKVKHLETSKKLRETYPQVDKFFKEKNLDPGKIREHSAKILGAGAIAGALLLTPPSDAKLLPAPTELINNFRLKEKSFAVKDPQKLTVSIFKEVLPETPRPLTTNEEKYLEQVFSNIIGIPAKATLEGEHLNTTYGYIGAEQHLRRYPNDALINHGEGEIMNEGMAPGLGAWGYFANSKEGLTSQLAEDEKWYAVVQTLYLPDWNTRTRYLREWYKYRKVLIVNTENGNAVVADIADSGPAAWTGKQFGGSPEVMNYLGGPKYKKGTVLLFFADDPENKIPLGPVEYNMVNSSIFK